MSDLVELSSMSTEMLLERLKFLEPQVRMLDVKQKAVKTLSNACYGITANKHFSGYDPDLGEAITLTGQIALRYSATVIDAFMNKVCGTQNIKHVYYGDTDSVEGTTKIWINRSEIEIANLYDSVQSDEIVTPSGNRIKKMEGYSTNTFEGGRVVEKNVPHIMKHKVKKRMYRIFHNGNTVVVTEDHSVMVRRNGSIISCKPGDMVKSDKVISLNIGTPTPRMEIKNDYQKDADMQTLRKGDD